MGAGTSAEATGRVASASAGRTARSLAAHVRDLPLGHERQDQGERLRHLGELNPDRLPALLAISRKDFIGALTQTRPKERLAGTLAAVATSSAAHDHHRRELVQAFGAYDLEMGTRWQSASLFRGIAGVGYALLRTLDATLPDVLSFAMDCSPDW